MAFGSLESMESFAVRAYMVSTLLLRDLWAAMQG